ncbi:NAD(P)H-dependent oxidoreductase [Dongia soli]|uniref:NAD(P)H-dependent oxidoreductase n=1 Tax=Dongia soli TaxID=600628 RepID=A0ABU5EEX3_9PROT|nr:NAD(P)H-dependent oxidoreductase [Dongia soli]MDY0884882.1 NAD(P)H-dependent oxidoreductase [Dongia soli]
MKCLVVVAHPLPDSLCASLAAHVVADLRQSGHEVTIEDLYQESFEPALTWGERQSYYLPAYKPGGDVSAPMSRLLSADMLVLVFPTWWFGFPAILKGWFDRVWAPGVAFDHTETREAITPRLTGLKYTVAVTTLGSPQWVDLLVLRRPVYRQIKYAILRPCAPQCRLKMLALYRSEHVTPQRVSDFKREISQALAQYPTATLQPEPAAATER